MTERPILFSSAMVRAILEDRKTQTRRIMNPQPPNWCTRFGFTAFTPKGCISGRGTYEDQGPAEKFFKLAGAVGDRLWVREAHAIFCVSDSGRDAGIGYRADHPCDGDLHSTDGGYNWISTCGDVDRARKMVNGERWRPSIFMPRWASRITLEITSVCVERLQDISEADAIAEGVASWEFNPEQSLTSRERAGDSPYRSGFAYLWDVINDKRATWKSNPYVRAISFRRVKP